MFATALRRTALLRPTFALGSQARYSSRLSASELRKKLDVSHSGETIAVDIHSKTEMSESGLADRYKIKVSDLKDILKSGEKEKEDARFQYSSGHVSCYINSSKSSSVAAEVRRRGQSTKKGGDEKELEEEFNGEYGAGNQEISKDSGSKQPVNL
ncbi:hypothetical protein DFJ77DRAFT_169986 [Powellomyces hirtus]|nr:hypothetical protein DFJ77DRAFT_169986 [Powellomyces hirtus]